MKQFITAALLSLSLSGFAQKIDLVEGDLTSLKGQTSFSLEFTYVNTGVGKFDKEADYVKQKQDELNKKTPGKGDTWAKEWEDDKEGRYKSQFKELFESKCVPIKTGSQYTIIFNTSFIEPGFKVTGMIKKNALINGEAMIVETNNKSKVIAKITVEKAPGRTFGLSDYDTGVRIQESYAIAGRELGEFIKKKIK